MAGMGIDIKEKPNSNESGFLKANSLVGTAGFDPATPASRMLNAFLISCFNLINLASIR